MTAEAAANWVIVAITLGIAIVGWHRGNAANRRAQAADDRAEEAFMLAQSAEARADRLERIQIEKHHVIWTEIDRNRDGISYRNAGTDTAHDVHLIADIKGHPRQETRLPTVAPTEPIGINLRSIITEEHAKQQAAIDRASGIWAGVPTVYVYARITWRSELGVPHDEDLGEVAL